MKSEIWNNNNNINDNRNLKVKVSKLKMYSKIWKFLIFSTLFVLFQFSIFNFRIFITQAVELTIPTIVVNPDIYYPLDEILYLEGRAVRICFWKFVFKNKEPSH